jgi:hypothetical protein
MLWIGVEAGFIASCLLLVFVAPRFQAPGGEFERWPLLWACIGWFGLVSWLFLLIVSPFFLGYFRRVAVVGWGMALVPILFLIYSFLFHD